MDVKVYISFERPVFLLPLLSMISQTSEYALRAIVFLGNEGVPRTAAEISRSVKAPPDYLSKVMRGLVREGIVASRQGHRARTKATTRDVVHNRGGSPTPTSPLTDNVHRGVPR